MEQVSGLRNIQEERIILAGYYLMNSYLNECIYCDVVCYKIGSEGEVNILTPLFESTGITTDR